MARRAAWILVLACALPALALPAFAGDQAVLSELWQRRVLPPDKNEASPADLLLLARMHRVEADDAVGYLRGKLHGLRGLAVLTRDRKTRQSHWSLTKEGLEKYLFLRTQDALAYFQQHDVGYKAAFLAKDMQDAAIFDQAGLLTDAGLAVYDRLLANVEAHYRLPDGTVGGNRAPPRPAEPPPEPVVAQPPVRRHRVTEPPPEARPEPAEQQPSSPPPGAAPPPAGLDAPPSSPQSGQAASPDAMPPQSASKPPPEAQSAPAPDPGPAPSDSD